MKLSTIFVVSFFLHLVYIIEGKEYFPIPSLFYSKFRIETKNVGEVGSIRNHQQGKIYFDILQGFRIDLFEDNITTLSIFGKLSDKILGDVTIYSHYFQSDDKNIQCIVWTTLEHLFPFYLQNKTREQISFSIPTENANLVSSFVNYIGIYCRKWQWNTVLKQFNPEGRQTSQINVEAFQSLHTNMIVGITVTPTPYGPLEFQLFDINIDHPTLQSVVDAKIQLPLDCI